GARLLREGETYRAIRLPPREHRIPGDEDPKPRPDEIARRLVDADVRLYAAEDDKLSLRLLERLARRRRCVQREIHLLERGAWEPAAQLEDRRPQTLWILLGRHHREREGTSTVEENPDLPHQRARRLRLHRRQELFLDVDHHEDRALAIEC